MKSINVIGYSKWLLSLSLVLMVASVVAILVLKPNYGIDFTGGSLIEVQVENTSSQTLREDLAAAGKEAIVQASENDTYFVRLAPITEDEHQAVLTILRTNHPELVENKFDSIGPTIGEQLKRQTLIAVVVLLILIALYIAWAFRRVSEPVSSWKYGLVTLLAAFHDVVIMVGVFAVLGKVFGYQVDIAFVAAMLTVLGYSINDTIVVLDRTRENLAKYRHASKSFAEIVNQSVVETLGRSINTTLTTLLPLVAIFLIGGASTRSFVLALIVGIVAGAYSSIFFASPLLVAWDNWSRRAR